jgi:uncharacterized protein (TIGR00369 family)
MLTEKLKALSSSPVWEHIGLELKFAENGKSEVFMPTKKEFLQIFGNVHGGILATLLDATMASAINTVLDDTMFSVTAEMKIQYLKSASGNYLVGVGEVVKHGKTLTVCKSEIYDENDQMVAFATGTFVNKVKT